MLALPSQDGVVLNSRDSVIATDHITTMQPQHIDVLRKTYDRAARVADADHHEAQNAVETVLEKIGRGNQNFDAEVSSYINTAYAECVGFMQQHGATALSSNAGVPNTKEARTAARALAVYADEATIHPKHLDTFKACLDTTIVAIARAQFNAQSTDQKKQTGYQL